MHFCCYLVEVYIKRLPVLGNTSTSLGLPLEDKPSSTEPYPAHLSICIIYYPSSDHIKMVYQLANPKLVPQSQPVLVHPFPPL